MNKIDWNGSSISRIYDEFEETRWTKDKKWLENLSDKIKNITPDTTEFSDLKWIVDNKERIIGNRGLINLLR